jgi:hypothetical protein
MNDDGGSYSYVAASCAIWPSIAPVGIEVQSKLLDPKHPKAAFWREAHGNFFDISVLDWCKLFADREGKHHWRRVVKNPDRFEADLYTDEFTSMIAKIKHYRDKFVAHLDQERTMLLPALDVARGAIVFLHERLVQPAGHGDWSSQPTSPEELEQGFAQAFREAQSVYAEALARLAVLER